MRYLTGTKSHSFPRPLRWVLLAAVILLIALVIAGCGGVAVRPLPQNLFADLGKEMAAIEQRSPQELATIATLTPVKIELIQALSPAQLANFANLKAEDLNGIQLGTNIAVVANLTPAQLTFIQNLNPPQLGVLDTLQLNRLAVIEEQMRANKSGDVEKWTRDRNTYASLWAGYISETRATLGNDATQYSTANTLYQQAVQSGGDYSAQARYQIGVLGTANKLSADSYDQAKKHLQPLVQPSEPIQLWTRTPALAAEGGPAVIGEAAAAGTPVLHEADGAAAAAEQLDELYKASTGLDGWYYRIVDGYVSFFRTISPFYGPALALIFLALIIKLVTIPLTNASFRGMRDMQRVQPLIKELQEKYKGDRQKLAEEQMKLMKEHKVSPLGGCLPMLIQLPIFIVVYRAVQVYAAGFADAHFIWINNLARPDMILLVLYALSMIVTQKLTTMPASDPQQKMMQTQMTYFMPVFLFIVLRPIASAFVLYWFFLNVFSSIHQYYLLQKFKKEDEARGIVTPAPSAPAKSTPTKKKGKKL